METLVLEVNKEQKKALRGILKYLKVDFYEENHKKNNPRDFAVKIDYGITEDISAKPYSWVEDSASYIKNIRKKDWE